MIEEEELLDLSPLTLSEDPECPVCLQRPTSGIYCCQECDNLVCGKCKDLVELCPLCRDDFRARPPARNKFAERSFRLN